MTQQVIPVKPISYPSCFCGRRLESFKNGRGEVIVICPAHGDKIKKEDKDALQNRKKNRGGV